jgi:predicted nucleotidyltransferase
MEKPSNVPPDIVKVKKIINEWVSCNPRITKVYLFGSYVKKNKPIPNDIDIAIEISHNENDTAHGFWCGEGSKMEKQLSILLDYEVDLEWFNGNRTPRIKKGLDEGQIVLYEQP